MNFWEFVAERHRTGLPYVVVTLVSARGRAPSDPGAKALVGPEGLLNGTVGGGKVEARAVEEARRMLGESARVPHLTTWNLQTDIGMTCGGEVSYLFEPHYPSAWQVAVFGAGHVGQALIRVLLPLPAQLVLWDSRLEWLGRAPQGENLRCRGDAGPEPVVADLQPNAFCCVVTQGHATDLPVLEALFRKGAPLPYVGVIGSVTKAGRLKEQLRQRGVDEPFLERLHCPMGLDIGSNRPEEIALSIAAQLLQERDRSVGA